jgi:hypothetical protein
MIEIEHVTERMCQLTDWSQITGDWNAQTNEYKKGQSASLSQKHEEDIPLNHRQNKWLQLQPKTTTIIDVSARRDTQLQIVGKLCIILNVRKTSDCNNLCTSEEFVQIATIFVHQKSLCTWVLVPADGTNIEVWYKSSPCFLSTPPGAACSTDILYQPEQTFTVMKWLALPPMLLSTLEEISRHTVALVEKT